MAANDQSLCLNKRREIYELKDEVTSRLQALGRVSVEKKKDFSGLPGHHQKYLLRPTFEAKENKPRGGRPDHNGSGRTSRDERKVDRIVKVDAESEVCPECGNSLEKLRVQDEEYSE